VANSNSVSKPRKRDTGDLRKELENADMGLFDRYMKWLVNVPKSAVDSKEKKNRLP